jgi:DNA-binding CsgD family transcriptional regulator
VSASHAISTIEGLLNLSRVEINVLELTALGLSSQDIADELWLSRQAITYHLTHLFHKLGAAGRTELVAKAFARGILVTGSWPPHVSAGVAI